MRVIFIGFVFSLCTLLAPSQLLADNFRDGVRAYNKKDFSTALGHWLPLAEQGNVLAQTLIGSMYVYGEGTERNDTEAVKWFTRAAIQGSAQAQYNLGIMYERGFGVEKDLNEARRWLLAAANQGRKEARQRLATLPASQDAITSTEQATTPTPAPDIEIKADKLADSTKKNKTVDAQATSRTPRASIVQNTTLATIPVIETKKNDLPGSATMSKMVKTQSVSLETSTDVALALPATPAPVPDIKTQTNELSDSSEKTEAVENQPTSLAINTVVEQVPTSTSAQNEEETDFDELTRTPSITTSLHNLLAGRIFTSEEPETPEMTETVENQPDNQVPNKLVGQASTSASVQDIEEETDFDELTRTPVITTSLHDLLAGRIFASKEIEQIETTGTASNIEINKDELTNTAAITLDIDTPPTSQTTVSTNIEKIQPQASESDTGARKETKTDELLGPPNIDITPGTDTSLSWLQEQPDNYYTIQLESSIEQHLIDARMKDLSLTDKVVHIVSNRNGQIWHAIVYGSFGKFNDARKALEALPETLRSRQPWIRSFGSIKPSQER